MMLVTIPPALPPRLVDYAIWSLAIVYLFAAGLLIMAWRRQKHALKRYVTSEQP